MSLIVKKPTRIFIFLALILMAWVSGADASTSHHHHEGVSSSPFQGELKSHSQHCQLNKHYSKTCPHTRTQSNSLEMRLAADCGGNPNTAVPTVSNPGSSHLLFSANFFSPVLKGDEIIFISSDLFQHFFPDPMDHPPRVS